jgi:hypothetical protein
VKFERRLSTGHRHPIVLAWVEMMPAAGEVAESEDVAVLDNLADQFGPARAAMVRQRGDGAVQAGVLDGGLPRVWVRS